jgi:hypothetical protein
MTLCYTKPTIPFLRTTMTQYASGSIGASGPRAFGHVLALNLMVWYLSISTRYVIIYQTI